MNSLINPSPKRSLLKNWFLKLFILLVLVSGCQPVEDDDGPAQFVALTDFQLQKVESGAIDVSLLPTLTWSPSYGSINGQDTKVVYEVNIAKVGEPFITGMVITTEKPFVTLTSALEPYTEYQWLVTARVVGTNETKASIETFSFVTADVQINPLPPELSLLSPENEIIDFVPASSEFNWESLDTTELSPYEYLLAIKEISDVGGWQTYLTDQNNFMVEDGLKPSTTYDWSVLGTDDKGNSVESETRTFTTASSGSTGQNIPGSSQVVSTSVRAGSGLEWGGCFGHAMVSHNSKLYDIGGRANENGTWRFGNDVYESSDGTSWTTLSENTDFNDGPFYPSNEHTALSHAGNLYVFSAAQSGVYTSAIGQVWTAIDTGSVANETMYENRRNHAAVSLNNDLYVMGGYNGSTMYSDVWKSTNDAQGWQKIKESDNSAWKGGEVYAVAVEGAIYLFETRENDLEPTIGIWKSTDGANWQFLRTVPWTANRDFAVCTYLYGMCVISGDENNKIWWSEDGLEWSEVKLENPSDLEWRKDHAAVELNGSIYVSYGYGSFTGDSRFDIVKIWFNP